MDNLLDATQPAIVAPTVSLPETPQPTLYADSDIDFTIYLDQNDYYRVIPSISWFGFRVNDDRLIRWQHLLSGVAGEFLFRIFADWGRCHPSPTPIEMVVSDGVLIVPSEFLQYPGAIWWEVEPRIPVAPQEFSGDFGSAFATCHACREFAPDAPFLTYPTGIECRPFAGRFEIPRIPIVPHREAFLEYGK